MYVFCDWMKCQCGNTNCLFYTFVDKRGNKERTVTSGKCKDCYLEDNRIKIALYREKIKKNRIKMYAQGGENEKRQTDTTRV